MSSAMRSERTRARRAQNGAGACLSGRSRSLGARRVRWASPHTRLSRICSSAAAIVVFAGSGWGGSVAVVVTVLAIVLRRPPSQVRPPPMPCVSSRVVGAADLHSCTSKGWGVVCSSPGRGRGVTLTLIYFCQLYSKHLRRSRRSYPYRTGRRAPASGEARSGPAVGPRGVTRVDAALASFTLVRQQGGHRPPPFFWFFRPRAIKSAIDGPEPPLLPFDFL